MRRLHFDIIIKGDIQNIALAFQSLMTAERLKINGCITYIDNTTAKIEAEGQETNLDEFIKWCSSGIFDAEGINVHVSQNKYRNYTNYTIKDIQKNN